MTLHRILTVKSKLYMLSDGFIVNPDEKELKSFKKTYDANGMIVMSGGIDIHSHIAGGNVNNARLLMPEIHKKFVSNLLENRKHFNVESPGGLPTVLVLDMH